jgi:uncharacterized repeat protein (TIGR03803 family)
MRKRLKTVSLVLELTAGLEMVLTGGWAAQTFTTLHNFTATSATFPFINGDGANPWAGLSLSGNTLYGTCYAGGAGGGVVFAINTDGTDFRNLHNFSSFSDGAGPAARLVVSGNTLYGTARYGSGAANGTVFALNTDGTSFRVLHSFTTFGVSFFMNSDGAFPVGGLVLLGDTLYGTARNGGNGANGTVFKLNTDGRGFTTLHSFTATSPSFPYTNGDGANPSAVLTLAGDTLYGTTRYGGSSGVGTLFKVNADGTGFVTLHNFASGGSPGAGLILSGNVLYGVTTLGGTSGSGTVFKVSTNGAEFATLYSFTGGSDGAFPLAELVSSGTNLYGTTSGGGSSGNGTMFALNMDGTGFTNLYSFTAGSGNFGSVTNIDGAYPTSALIFSHDTLYGAARYGGTYANGTVFNLSLGSVSLPQLTITRSGPNVILTWPTAAIGFTLQYTTNLASLTGWTTVSPGPVIVEGQNTVTNPISGTQQFYRLTQ